MTGRAGRGRNRLPTEQGAHGNLEQAQGMLIGAYDLALCDLDGVAFHGTTRIDTAIRGIQAARDAGLRFLFLTNNAMRTPGQVAAHLAGCGIPTAPDDVMTSAMAAAHLCGQRYPRGTRVLTIGGDGLREALSSEELSIVASADDAPAVVVQGLAYDVSWKELTEAVFAINAGADYVASNLDTTLPTERGFAIGNGSLVAAVVSATGVRPVSTGKPAPEIFKTTADREGAVKPLVIGDRLDTDIAGGLAAGYDCVHVLTGVSEAGAVIHAQPSERPTYLLRDLTELTEPYSPARVVEASTEHVIAACSDREVRVTIDRVALRADGKARGPISDGDTIDLHTYRALATAAWAASDAGFPPRDYSNLEVGGTR